jgi:FdhE protein
MSVEGIPETALCRLPVAEKVFEARRARFHALAVKHAAGDYLTAMAHLVSAQQMALAKVRFNPEEKKIQGEFPLNTCAWRRDQSWRQALSVILSEMEQAALPPVSRAAIGRLSGYSTGRLESAADEVLAGDCDAADLACATFLGAALQTYWTALAGVATVEAPRQTMRTCPVCASPPIAGVVLGDQKVRYLVCGLCAVQWYMPRLTCVGCGSAADISYLSIEGDQSRAKAEACAQCGTYLKLFYLESDPHVEPFVDDIATLALDFMMSEEGFSRRGLNLFLVPGAEP